MDGELILGLVFRWLHMLAAITAVGGTVFARFVVVPALDEFPTGERGPLHAAMRKRWSKIVAGAIGFLLVSGLYNIGVTSIRYALPRWYMPVFVVKFLAAFVIFFVASLLAGKTAAAERIRRNVRPWLNLNIGLAVLVVCLSGVLRTAEKVPKEKPPEKSPPGEASAAATGPSPELWVEEMELAGAVGLISLEGGAAGAG